MIVTGAPPLGAAEAARRAGGGALPVWFVSPGEADVGVEREFVACDPVRVVRGSSVDALEDAWREERAGWAPRPGVPIGVGFLSYDLGRRFERIGGPARPPSAWPDLEFRFYDALWTRDARTGRAEIWASSERAGRRLLQRLARPAGSTSPEAPSPTALEPLLPLEPAARHLDGVARVLEYVHAGDAYQVNLARRLGAKLGTAGTPPETPPGWALFARLQAEAPAPHAFWLVGEADGSCLIGNSPERFLRLDPNGAIETRPIKGTRPRGVAGDTDAVDGTLAAELASHPKDRAEHVMIVDLERNDLGRVCVTGSVKVSGFARVVSLPTVHHLVTTVSGQLRPGIGLAALLRATFPGGSVTGAPKIRAMQIIDELEAERRGPYTGATGWLGAAGDLDLAVAIRTALVRDGELTLWVGGGVVADSDPAEELRETDAKAEAFARLAGG